MSKELKPRILRLEIEEDGGGKTIKEYLKQRIGFSSKQLSRFKYRRDGILVNGEKRYVNYALSAGDVLELRLTQGGEPVEEDQDGPGGRGTGGYLPARDGRLQKIWAPPARWLAEGHPLRILYEDEDILAADKPSGVVCHPSPGHFDDTLSNQVAEHLGRIGQELDVRVTGRLDRDTSGIVIFALNTETAAQLIRQRERSMMSKLYIARVRGHFSDRGEEAAGTVDRPLRRKGPDSFLMVTAEDGKPARTHYRVLEEMEDGSTLAACRIEHGRTHQIRVHMASICHPLIGDCLYGEESSEDGAGGQGPLMLHAFRAELVQPFTGKKICLEAPLPDWAGALHL
ncbi:MAG: RluA family pseudouridine synthase [Lachnospiraceae bacterium]|nr:RluA family pseudouridine synthase [Lachnospiraceae bacterium]